eukprot:403355522
MMSPFTLRINNQKLNDKFDIMRLNEIKWIGLVGVVLRILMVGFGLINNLIFLKKKEIGTFCFFYEKTLKESFLYIHQIKKMNKELKQLFDQLPEGVILFNQQNHHLNKLLISKCLMDYDKKLEKISVIEATEDDKLNFDSNLIRYQIFIPEVSITNESQQGSYNIENGNVVSISKCQLLYNNEYHTMIMFRNLTSMIQCENLRIENHFYEMLTATVSHDLRTPLNAIIGLLNNLDSFITDQRGQLFLSIIKNSSHFMNFLVNDLLDYFQIKNGKFTANCQQVDINQSMAQLIEIFSLGAREKGINLSYTFSQQVPPTVLIDEQRTRQIVLNLLQNALKFTFRGSIRVFLDYNMATQQLIIEVSDTGVGIKLEDQQKLFQMFGKLESTASINTSGIGLGLSICKKIVETLSGEITIDTQYQNGAKFIVKLAAPTLNPQQIDEQVDIEDFSQTQIDLTTIQNTNTYYNKTYLDSQLINRNSDNLIHQNYGELNTQRNFIIMGEQSPRGDQEGDIFENSHSQIVLQKSSSQQQLLCQHNQRITYEDDILLNFPLQQRENQLPKILVVDDNIFNIVTIQAILEMQFKLKSDKATNGDEAVHLFSDRLENSNAFEGNYTLIFMDCNMPIMDGFQATEEIRRLETINSQNKCKIVALTAYQTEMFKNKSMNSGMDEYMTKPISSDQIRNILTKYQLVV